MNFAAETPISLPDPTVDEEFIDLIDMLVADFKHFVEQRGGWRLLFNDGGDEKDEEAARELLFRGLAEARCVAHNIVIDREVNLRARSRRLQVLCRLHQSSASRGEEAAQRQVLEQYEKQLVSYLTSDNCGVGRFVAIPYRNHRPRSAVASRATTLRRRTADLASRLSLNVASEHVGFATPRSASAL